MRRAMTIATFTPPVQEEVCRDEGDTAGVQVGDAVD